MEKKPVEEEIKTSYLEYAMSVIVNRAIPDVRDGLKPVQRRILYSMSELNLTHDKPYKKCARIVGETMGKYHPHGDAAIYDALARMAQDFSLRYPLVDGQGNFGSIDGDSPAAMRYTEARLSPISEEMLADIEKDTVPSRLNFDGTLSEPEYFPSKVPNLLLNGASGIAVGMATNMVPHNLNEVCDAIDYQLDNQNCTVEELLRFVKGPDFPGGGVLFQSQSLIDAYLTGRGKVVCQGEVDLSKEKMIEIKSLPYTVNKSIFIQGIAELVKNEVIRGITDIKDESDRNGMHIIVKVRDNDMRPLILNQLYEHTDLELSISINNLVLVNNEPKTLNLKEMIQNFIDHRLDIITKRSRYDLNKLREREHILLGLSSALSRIDQVIEAIRKSKDAGEARAALQSLLDIDQVQANAILDMKLQRLTSLETSKLQDELATVRQKIQDLDVLLSDEVKRRLVVKEEIQFLKTKFGDERRTNVMFRSAGGRTIEDLIPNESDIIVLSETGFLKRVSLNEYRAQKRGGKGIITSTVREDTVKSIVPCSSHDDLFLFTNSGRVLKIKAYEIDKKSRTSVSVTASYYVKLGEGESVQQVMKASGNEDDYLMIITKGGFVKKTSMKSLLNMRSSGLRIITLNEDDEVASVENIGKKNVVFTISSAGKASAFDVSEVRPTGRSSRGVRAMRLGKNQYIISGFMCSEDQDVLTISEYGIGKRTPINEFNLHHRGTSGMLVFKESERTGKLVKAIPVKESQNIIIVTQQQKSIRIPVKDVKMQSRVTSGVKLIDVGEDDRVISISSVDTQETDP